MGVVALGGLGGSSPKLGHINNHHSCTPCSSHHTVRMFFLEGSNKAAVSLMKKTCLSMGRFFDHSLVLGVKDWY